MGDIQIGVGDGRVVDVRVSGPETGVPLVFHHGTPGAKPVPRAVERAAHERGIRLITYSRPGCGGSTRHEGRRVVDAVADTAAILDHLGVERCLIAGWSGGGPHAMACAARLDHAVGTLVIAGFAPYEADGLDWLDGMGEDNVVEFGAAASGADELRQYLEQLAEHLRNAEAADFFEQLSSLLPDVDRAVLTGEFAEDLVAQTRESLRARVDGWLDDDLAFVSPWGFDLAEITKPLMLWQGSEDLMVPFAHGQWLAADLPDATAHLEPDQGHLSIAVGSIDRMLDELTATFA